MPSASAMYCAPVFFFPLVIFVGVLGARRSPLPVAMGAGTAVFGVAVLVSWQVQGFQPTPRDLVWLAIVLGATYLSSRKRKEAAHGTD